MNFKYFFMSACLSVLGGSAIGQTFSFTSRTRYSVDPKPHCVRAADLNNDGHIDLVSANRDNANVRVFLGLGDGSFQQGTSYSAGAGARDLAIADYDGDGYLDLAVANDGADYISILFNNGDGSFPVKTNYDASHVNQYGDRCRPWHIESADFNLDGYPDLIVSVTNKTYGEPYIYPKVYLFLNNGDGTFVLSSLFEASGDPRGLCAGDFDGDGDFDFAVACRSGSVGVYMNNGDGTFTRGGRGAPGGPVDICAADFDGDSDLDLAIVTELDSRATIMLNNGDGTFVFGSSKKVGDPHSINSADMDGDGDQDLLIASMYNEIIPNDGNGNFGSGLRMTSGGWHESICAADFDGDGDNDLAYALAYRPKIITWENITKEAGYQTPILSSIGPLSVNEGMHMAETISATDPEGVIPTLSTSALPAGATFVDYADGSGQFDWTPDFTQNGVYNVTFRASDGIAIDSEIVTITVYDYWPIDSQMVMQFEPPQYYPVDQAPHCIRAADLDNDGNLDLVSANRDNANVSVFIGFGDGSFQSGLNYSAGLGARDLGIADYDGDGYLDLVVANDGTEFVSVLLNNGDGTFPVTTNYPAGHADNTGGFCRPWHIASADYDHDGHPDFVVTVTNKTEGDAIPNDKIYLFLNNGDGTFLPPIIIDVSDDPRGVCAGDFDGDGDFDFAVGSRSGYMDIYKNDGSATFERVTFDAPSMPLDICAADFDGDSDLDIAILTELDWSAVIWLNNGNGVFSHRSTKWVGKPWSINSADMDGDGDQDLLVAANNGQILPNDGTGYLASATTVLSGGYPRSICGADFDGDGDIDLAIANAYQFFIMTWENVTNEAANQPPVLAAIGPQSVAEGTVLAVPVSATDAEGIPVLSTSVLPTGALFTDSTDGSGQLDWTPDFTQAGVYSVSFYASDGVEIDSEIVVITVTDEPETAVDDNSPDGIPSTYSLFQNYPNPFNPVTSIDYNLPRQSHVTIEIFNLTGQLVRKLVDETKAAGEYRIEWDGRDSNNRQLATGIYFYRLRAGDYVETREMLLLK